MALAIRNCVYVVSFPRSGTHLVIDLIRRNFPNFNPRLMPWESASRLYLNLDGENWQRRADEFLQAHSSHLLVKSHRMGSRWGDDVERYLHPQRQFFIYPFRRFSKVVKSYAEFGQWQKPISGVLREKDWLIDRRITLAECIRAHATSWMERDAVFIDCDLLCRDPQTAVERLSKLLDEPPAAIANRLPRQKLYPGKVGELIERLTGRQSTAMRIAHTLEWQSPDEELAVDNEFSDLYGALSQRRIN